MNARFEVQGKDADELLARADAQARKFAAGHAYVVTSIDADQQIVTGAGEILYYIATVHVEVTS